MDVITSVDEQVPDLRGTGLESPTPKKRCWNGGWRFLGPSFVILDRRRRTAVGGRVVVGIKEESDVFVTHI